MPVPISNVTRRVVYAASGTGPYSFTFEILAAGDIAVYRDDTLLTLTTNYTVTINANGTGYVTLTATPTGATQIAIVGNRTIQRTTDFVTGGDFFANTLNDELDQQTIFAQQNAEGLQRALQAPQTDPTSINMTLPGRTARANKTLSFDANGDPTPGVSAADVANAVTYASNAAASATAAASSASSAAASASSAATSAASAAAALADIVPASTGGTYAGAVRFVAGSASVPSISVDGDTNTGIFFPAADTIAFTEGGTESFRLNSSGQVAVNAAGSASTPTITKADDLNTGVFFPAADTVAIGTGGTEALRVNSSQNVGIGGTPAQRLDVFGVTSDATPVALLRAYTTGADGARTVPVRFVSSNNNNWANAQYEAYNHNFHGNGALVMTVKQEGAVVLKGGDANASGTGITFPATQSASSNANTLDDYEEGTWTPAIAGGSGTTYNTQAGWYTKVGNLVTIGFDLNINAKGTISGNAQITGLPFTSGSSPSRAGGGFAVSNSLGTAYVSVSGFIDNGATAIDIYIRTAAATSSSVPTGTAFFAASSQLIASFSYRV